MNNKLHITLLVFILSFFSIGQVTGASLELDRNTIDKIKRLPKAQQAALAKRYGSDLEDIIGPTETELVEDRGVLGMPAEPLVPIGEEPFDEDFAETLKLEDEKAEEEFELKRFGSDFFDDDISTFAPVTSQISRITLPPVPITSRILSRGIDIVVMRGALSDTLSRAALIALSISPRICIRPSLAWSKAIRMISSVIDVILMSICSDVTPVDVPATLKSMSPK